MADGAIALTNLTELILHPQMTPLFFMKHIKIMPTNKLIIEIALPPKKPGEITVYWEQDTINNNGHARSMTFGNEANFLEFCEVFKRAEKLYSDHINNESHT